MTKALVFQWPETYHRHCVYEYDYEEEFLDAWNKTLDKYSLQDNDWIMRLFIIKEKWTLLYGRYTFCANMISTQQSESMDKVIKEYITYKNNLRTYIQNFQQLLSECIYVEMVADFKSSQSKVALSIPIKNLTHAAYVYTPKVFTLFQEELRKGYDCHIENIGKFAGTLCCHILKMFCIRDVVQVLENPRRAIGRRYRDLCRISTRLATRATNFEEVYRMVRDSLMNLLKEIDLRCAGNKPFESNTRSSLLVAN
ncbi:hypothetical protein V2J09_022431 [Rumex salicifolius]